MFWTWVIVGCIIGCVGAYLTGANSHKLDEAEIAAYVFIALTIAVCWPLFLFVAIIVGPFVGVFWLGKRRNTNRRVKQNDRRSKESNP